MLSQIFNFNQTSGPVTYHDLHKWTRKSFEKLGWMILAIKYNDYGKINCYIDSLEKLKNSLQKKYDQTQEEDRKNDIQILFEQVEYLQKYVNKNLKEKQKMDFGKRRKN